MSRRVRIIVFAFGLAAFLLLILQAGVSGLLEEVRRFGPGFLLLIGVWAVVYALNTVAWAVLIQAAGARTGREGSHAHIPLLHAYMISVGSFAINYVTPFLSLIHI